MWVFQVASVHLVLLDREERREMLVKMVPLDPKVQMVSLA